MKWRTPAGPLVHEHRLIERMMALVERQLGIVRGGAAPDTAFMHAALDFIRSYADECHHGKEEAILFKVLAEKGLEPRLADMMAGLIDDHARGRQTVRQLESHLARFEEGQQDALLGMREAMTFLTQMYPKHIYTEDHEFFPAVMEYLDDDEKVRMLADYDEFDRSLIHKRYESVVQRLEESVSASVGG